MVWFIRAGVGCRSQQGKVECWRHEHWLVSRPRRQLCPQWMGELMVKQCSTQCWHVDAKPHLAQTHITLACFLTNHPTPHIHTHTHPTHPAPRIHTHCLPSRDTPTHPHSPYTLHTHHTPTLDPHTLSVLVRNGPGRRRSWCEMVLVRNGPGT